MLLEGLRVALVLTEQQLSGALDLRLAAHLGYLQRNKHGSLIIISLQLLFTRVIRRKLSL